MKRTLLLILAVSAVLSTPAFAALGDTESEIESLFGKPDKAGFPDKNGVTTNLYRKGNYIILVQFLKHLSLAESYTRTDQNELSQTEIDVLLDGNSNDRAWKKDPTRQVWERDDHKARAWCETLHGQPTLLIQAK
jgi:hypothetical protein